VLADIFEKLPRPGDSKVNFSAFESSCHLLLPVYLLKGRGIHVKCLAQDRTRNKRTYRLIFTLLFLSWTSSREAVNTNIWS